MGVSRFRPGRCESSLPTVMATRTVSSSTARRVPARRRLQRLVRSALVIAGISALALTSVASGAPSVVQTNWTIVSATGTSHYVANGSVGSGANLWTFDADITATWRQTAKNAKLPGWYKVSFNFKTMAPYVAGRAGAQRNPIRDVAATVNGRAESTDYLGSGSCRIRGAAPKLFFSGSAANEVFLDSRTRGASLVAYVEGQAPLAVIASTPACGKVHLPVVYDVKRERIKRLGLSLVQETVKGTQVSLVLRRSVPVVEGGETVGAVTELSKLILRLESGS